MTVLEVRTRLMARRSAKNWGFKPWRWLFGVVFLFASVSSVSANNTQTINTSDGYVDLSIAAAFTTIPNLCTEPVGSANTTTTACNSLGAAAVSAANGSGLSPDQYFESRFPDGAYASTNSFVPNGSTAVLGDSGYMPIFSQHKYNLFGRSGEFMGPLTREELLFVTRVNNLRESTPAQTQPGSDEVQNMLVRILTAPQGATTVTDPVTGGPGSITFNIADLPTYERLTGLTTGALSTVNSYCSTVLVSFICNILAPEVKALIWLGGNAPNGLTASCGAGGAAVGLSLANCNAREQWIDQVVVGYIESFDDPNNPTASLLKQNFRTQMNFDPQDVLLAARTFTDSRIEQDVTLGGSAFHAARQTMQQAFAATSTEVVTFGTTMGQLVTQDVEGWFYSCLNCDSVGNTLSHAFTPVDLNLTFMPYTNTWRDLPSISHGASGGNLSAFASAPGQPGP